MVVAEVLPGATEAATAGVSVRVVIPPKVGALPIVLAVPPIFGSVSTVTLPLSLPLPLPVTPLPRFPVTLPLPRLLFVGYRRVGQRELFQRQRLYWQGTPHPLRC